jgi:putative phosphonate metabolism protein
VERGWALPEGVRFAIYFVPAPESALYRFGAAVLGYDCYSGQAIARPPDLGLSAADWEDLTREPRTYGFHATLKAPFWLAGAFDQAELIKEVRGLAASLSPAPPIEPLVGEIAGFIAIVPRAASLALEKLAARCVTALDRLRLPLTPQERERRLAGGLSDRQIALLDSFGYPYVLEEFRFHMTLTGRIASDRRAVVHALLRDAFARAVGSEPMPIDRLAVLRQDHPQARFRVIDQIAL